MMNIITANLDITPKGLFPNRNLDEKCLAIAKVIEEISKSRILSTHFTQETLQRDVEGRYQFLSQEIRMSQGEVNHKIAILQKLGVSAKTAQAYYAFKLNN